MRLVLPWLIATGCSATHTESPDAANDAARADAAAPSDAPSVCPSVTRFDPGGAAATVGDDAPGDGIGDPSIVYPAAAPGGAMAYSAVPDQLTIRTHLAVSIDHGASWTAVAEANVPEAATIAWDDPECGHTSCSGNLISEVPSLIYDPDDPNTNARWKLFTHRYLVSSGSSGVVLHYRLGTIALQTAPDPSGPWTPPAKWIGWNTTGSTYSSSGVHINASSLAGTADCLVLSEPAAIVLPGVIDLAVGCVYLDNGRPRIRIELLRSIDHAASFASVGTLLHPDDAACLTPGGSINAPDLFVAGSTEYISATPSDDHGYHGCLVFAIDDPASGHVSRDANGKAIVTRAIAPTSDQFSGACTYADGTGGYMLDVVFWTAPPQFRIQRPGIATP